jgi:hypothetical protein
VIYQRFEPVCSHLPKRTYTANAKMIAYLIFNWLLSG